jgi:type VI secretion system secreted protein Hcp
LRSAATHLAFAQQPTDAFAADYAIPSVNFISPPVKVVAEDQFNHVVGAFSGLVSLGLESNPGQATLGGITAVPAEQGVASFPLVSLDQAGTGFTMIASVSSLLPAIGLSIDDGYDVARGEIEVLSFGWGVSRPISTAGVLSTAKPILDDFTVNISPTTADPGLLVALAGGKHLRDAVIECRTNLPGSPVYLTYKLTDVLVSAYSTSNDSEGPHESLALNFGTIEEDYRPIQVDGLGAPEVSRWERKTNKTTTGPVTGDMPATTPAMSLTFNTGAGHVSNAIEVKSFQWDATNSSSISGSANKASMQDFHLVLDAGSAGPELWGATAIGEAIPEVVLHIRANLVGSPEYLTYKFTDVLISAYSLTGGGDRPQESLSLSFGTLEEDYRPMNADGNLGEPVVSQWDRKTNKTSTGPIAGDMPAATPAMGLTFDSGAGHVSYEIEVDSFNWGASNASSGSASKASVQDFHFVINAGSAGPGLWAAVAAGQHIPTVQLHVRKAGVPPQEYLTYTFTDVLVSAYSASADGDQPQESLSLSFGKLEEDYRPVKPDGDLGAAVVSQWERKTNKTTKGPIAGDMPAGTPAMGLTFNSAAGHVSNEIEVEAFSWGATNSSSNGGTGKVGMQDFQFIVDSGSAGPELWAAVTAGQHIPTVQLHVRKAGVPPEEYLTYTFTDVLVSGYSASGGADKPQEAVSLQFSKLEEDYRSIMADGDLGALVVSQWDRKTNKTTKGPIAGDMPATPPAMSVTFSTSAGHVSNEIEVTSFSWRATNPSSSGGPGKVSMQDFQCDVDAGSAGPELWGAVATGQHIATVQLHVRTAGVLPKEYLTYTFTDVLVSGYAIRSGTDRLPESLSLNFSKLEEDYRPIKADGSLRTPAISQWDRKTNKTTTGPIAGDVPVNTPAMGLTFNPGAGHVSNEIEVTSFNWGAINASSSGSGGGKVKMQDIQLAINAKSAGPELWAAVASGQHIPEVELHLRVSGILNSPEYLTYTFTDVLVSSFADGQQQLLSLHFSTIEMDWTPIAPDGSLGDPIVGQWDLKANKGSGEIVGPPPPVLSVVSNAFAVKPVPVTTGLDVATAQEGDQGFALTVTGSGFIAASVVRWNGVDLATTFIDSTHLRAAIPTADLAEEGAALVTVYTPGSGGAYSNGQVFMVTDAPLQAAGLTLNGIGHVPFISVAVATFTDANLTASLDDFTATIYWGDNSTGQIDTGTVAVDQNHTFYVVGSHTYATSGQYQIAVSIYDGHTNIFVSALAQVWNLP